ncbi:Hypothetical predicted protein [Octopus vulgaris]|uniref:Uncharacterized protein n=1 Tax=Octopus vulgaris TaxID=6645 RepID=A0AA36B1Z6_OCTVU|nr:Hypothetical predicted protein [Octopus vulgaris]
MEIRKNACNSKSIPILHSIDKPADVFINSTRIIGRSGGFERVLHREILRQIRRELEIKHDLEIINHDTSYNIMEHSFQMLFK